MSFKFGDQVPVEVFQQCLKVAERRLLVKRVDVKAPGVRTRSRAPKSGVYRVKRDDGTYFEFASRAESLRCRRQMKRLAGA